jgi:hypothetical protein
LDLSSSDGSRAVDPAAEKTDPDGAPLTFTPEINEIYRTHSARWSRIGKYAYEQGGTANMSNDFVVFRLADIVLSLAEAKYRQGETAEALVWLTTSATAQV